MVLESSSCVVAIEFPKNAFVEGGFPYNSSIWVQGGKSDHELDEKLLIYPITRNEKMLTRTQTNNKNCVSALQSTEFKIFLG
jgi:hypothetical protein